MLALDEVLARFTADQIAEARRIATARQSSTVASLDELAALPHEVFISKLSTTFHYPAAGIEELHSWRPAFDVLPFAEAMRAQVILFHDETGALRMVFGDPFATDRLAWGEDRIDAPFTWTLAHHADVAAYLARYEETLSAVESVLPTSVVAAAAGTEIEDLSFRSITEDASQVVK